MPFIVEPDQIAFPFMHQRQRRVLDLYLWPSLSIMPHPLLMRLGLSAPPEDDAAEVALEANVIEHSPSLFT